MPCIPRRSPRKQRKIAAVAGACNQSLVWQAPIISPARGQRIPAVGKEYFRRRARRGSPPPASRVVVRIRLPDGPVLPLAAGLAGRDIPRGGDRPGVRAAE